MYIWHFLKMFFLLILMAALGIGGLVLANHYAKDTASDSSSGSNSATTPSVFGVKATGTK